MISTPPEAANTQKAMVDKMEDKADDAREACKEGVQGNGDPCFLNLCSRGT